MATNRPAVEPAPEISDEPSQEILPPSTPELPKGASLSVDLTEPVFPGPESVTPSEPLRCKKKKRIKLRWSDRLGIKSVREINGLVKKPVDDVCQELEYEHGAEVENYLITVKTPQDYFRAVFMSYYTHDENKDFHCRMVLGPLPYLVAAKRACKSYLKKLDLRNQWQKLFPSMLIHPFNEEELIEACEEAYEGNLDDDARYEKCKEELSEQIAETAWLSKMPGYETAKVTQLDSNSIELTVNGYTITRIETLAFGDFDHDGVEDVLLAVAHFLSEGSYNADEFLVMTRKNADKPLELIETWDPPRSHILVPKVMNRMLGEMFLTKEMIIRIRRNRLFMACINNTESPIEDAKERWDWCDTALEKYPLIPKELHSF